MSKLLRNMGKYGLGTVVLGGLAAVGYGLFLGFTGGWGIIPSLIIGGGVMAAASARFAQKKLDNQGIDTGEKKPPKDPGQTNKAKSFGRVGLILGGLLSVAAIVAAPFTGGASLMALWGTLSMAGMGLLSYAFGHSKEKDKTGKAPSGGKRVGQFFAGLLKGAAILGVIAAASLALISLPITFGGSVGFLAPVTSALAPIVTSIASFFGLGGAATAAGTAAAATAMVVPGATAATAATAASAASATVAATTLATTAGYIGAGAVALGGIGYVTHRGLSSSSSQPKPGETGAPLTDPDTEDVNENKPLNPNEHSYQHMHKNGLQKKVARRNVDVSEQEYQALQRMRQQGQAQQRHTPAASEPEETPTQTEQQRSRRGAGKH